MAIKHINAAVFAAIAIVAGCRTPEPPAEWDDRLPDPATLKINEGRKIKFAYPLPRMMCGDVRCGTYNNMELSLPGVLTTSDCRLGMFLQKLRETIMANRRLVFVDGKVVVCNLNWIRDHVQIMKGWKHWEYEPLSFLQFIIDTQRVDGQFFELGKQCADAFLYNDFGSGWEWWPDFDKFHQIAIDELNAFNYEEYKANGFRVKHLGDCHCELYDRPEGFSSVPLMCKR